MIQYNQYKRIPALGLAAALALLGGACSSSEKAETLVCPVVNIDRTTSALTRFRDGPGHDLTDVVLSAEIEKYEGDCGYNKGGVDVSLMVSFRLNRGPAAINYSMPQDLEYFVAVAKQRPVTAVQPPATPQRPVAEAEPAKDFDILNKEIFKIPVKFPTGIEGITYRDDAVAVSIPLKNKKDFADSYRVYVGLQLSPDQLKYNRAHNL
ncbi:MAG: hypothetical protein HQL37_00295 [Alphaproteobacteria bacterium]|nr:hypothetical protein [Alphaproteobacteria bacterium]